MSEEIEDDDEEEGGGAGWVMTFADLMSLLMCFFVLLLSFSEMDVQKYKQVAGSMKDAFGIQRDVKADVIPKGTSMVTDKFSPGRPDPMVVLAQMKQDTTDDMQESLEIDQVKLEQQAADLATILVKLLRSEIDGGILDILLEGNMVSIRIRERDSFPSGSAELQNAFYPILTNVARILDQSAGRIIVGGHTDRDPISTAQFPSNWVLSAVRAAKVVHYLVDGRIADISRVELHAYADTEPVVKNAEGEDQAKNRRIEIVILFDGVTGEEKDTPQTLVEMLGISGL